jgi:predicted membrane-bound spermidine synthase
MQNRAARIAPLLLLSGMCALIYQNTWQREFRLVFGASTAASAAVIAVFIGGLGLGGLLLARRVEAHPRPLVLYASFETAIALSAAVTPGLMWLARKAYIGLGGTLALGAVPGNALRLVLASLVLAVPTLLMGGTLPAASRALQSDTDPSRRGVAVLYGFNTFGAVAGCLLATFLLLETFGSRLTLWMACLVNLAVAVVARLVGQAMPAEQPAERTAVPAPVQALVPAPFVLVASAVVGFAFFLMELVWYRMLAPILGGTVFTFGLILAAALFGIGIGSAAYALRGQQRPATVAGFSATCLLEAALLAIPFALGDRIAALAIAVRSFGGFGFWGYAAGWWFITMLVIVPAAAVAGYQFPMLIALLGRGRQGVGRHVAWAYASNTLGAIVGSLAGGFGLLPWLSAPGCWRLVTIVLVLLGLGAVVLSARRERAGRSLLSPVALAVLAVWMLLATGPTAAWRQSPIGAGRQGLETISSPNAITRWIRERRHWTLWLTDGVESAVGVTAEHSLAFMVNGKVDGNARADAPTQVMGGLIGSILHPEPRKALVIGLGTGSTAGWLGVVPGIEQVDVIELEPAILRVARECAAVNQDVLNNPKVHVIIGDAREVLQVSRTQYDVVLSEPSNPYRSGVASLFTREYYQSALGRLAPGGRFVQWVQGYEVDGETIRTIYATFASVFPVVETWQLRRSDMVLIGTLEPVRHDLSLLRARIGQEPYRSALAQAWRVGSVEGFLGHYMARPEVGAAIAAAGRGQLNTDDLTLIEFGFARSLSTQVRFDSNDIIELARSTRQDLPEISGEIDWQRVEQEREMIAVVEGESPRITASMTPDTVQRITAMQQFVKGEFAQALASFREQPEAPSGPQELVMMGEVLADVADPVAEVWAELHRRTHPAEADAIMARLRYVQNRPQDSARYVEAVIAALRRDPWPWSHTVFRTIKLAESLASGNPAMAAQFFDLLKTPLSTMGWNEYREDALVALSRQQEPAARCRELFDLLGPHLPWEEALLKYRRDCYEALGHPGAAHARAEHETFLSREPTAFSLLVQVR